MGGLRPPPWRAVKMHYVDYTLAIAQAGRFMRLINYHFSSPKYDFDKVVFLGLLGRSLLPHHVTDT